MKTRLRFVLWLLLAVAVPVGLWGMIDRWNRPVPTPTEQTKQTFLHHLQTFDSLVNTRLLPLTRRSQSTDSLQRAFLACRLAYKSLEPFAEYYFPTTSRLVNGPPLPEIEAEENKEFEPGGLQVLEEFLFPTFDTLNRAELVREVQKMQGHIRRYRMLWEITELTDAHVFDALRLQVFRVIALGISGFDTPVCQTAIPEAARTLAALRAYLRPYASDKPAFATLQTQLKQAETYLAQHPDFDSFDRAYFITAHANPISAQLLAYSQQLGITPFDERRLLRANAPTLFAENLFDPDALASTVANRANPAKIALGERLFHDPVLSANNRCSCASCHQPDKAFTDGLVKNKTLTGQGLIGRNTPTLLNAALQLGQFYDMRAPSLESQSFDVVHNQREMHGSMDEVARKLAVNPDYVALFKRAFPSSHTIEPTQIQNALASYERSLLSFNSPFDHFMRGDKTALTAGQVQGFNVFLGKGKCGICHFVPLFNGTVPPNYAKTESEVIGTPATLAQKVIDPDLGRYAQTKLEPLKYAFKTPTLRNVALTAPYMHNGVYKTLDEVIEFYDQGGGRGLGFDLPNQTLPADKLNLSKAEKKALVLFLNALTETAITKRNAR
ncbi:MAG: cytochrome C peroxidase [Cytophagaceae bacterium]|nr:cytochrome C peroxidase [Cytophagaceae bacterium]